MSVCPFNATAIQPYFNGLSDEISCSSSNEVTSNQSLTEKDTEFVVNENSSSHQYTFTEKDNTVLLNYNFILTCMYTRGKMIKL